MSSSTLPALDLTTEVHPHFPALASHPEFAFADNAGGSQILASVVNAVSSFLIESNVQMGGGYQLSTQAMSKVAEGAEATGESNRIAQRGRGAAMDELELTKLTISPVDVHRPPSVSRTMLDLQPP